MSSALDMSLDDIINKTKKSAAAGGGPRGAGKGRGSGGAGPARRLQNRSGNRAAPYSATGKAPDSAWQHDMYSDQMVGFPAPATPRSAAIETGTKLYISNLDYGVSNEDIKRFKINIKREVGRLLNCPEGTVVSLLDYVNNSLIILTIWSVQLYLEGLCGYEMKTITGLSQTQRTLAWPRNLGCTGAEIKEVESFAIRLTGTNIRRPT